MATVLGIAALALFFAAAALVPLRRGGCGGCTGDCDACPFDLDPQ